MTLPEPRRIIAEQAECAAAAEARRALAGWAITMIPEAILLL